MFLSWIKINQFGLVLMDIFKQPLWCIPPIYISTSYWRWRFGGLTVSLTTTCRWKFLSFLSAGPWAISLSFLLFNHACVLVDCCLSSSLKAICFSFSFCFLSSAQSSLLLTACCLPQSYCQCALEPLLFCCSAPYRRCCHRHGTALTTADCHWSFTAWNLAAASAAVSSHLWSDCCCLTWLLPARGWPSLLPRLDSAPRTAGLLSPPFWTTW